MVKLSNHILKLQILALMLFTALSVFAQPVPDDDVGGGGGGGYASEIDTLAQLLPKEVSFYSNENNIFVEFTNSGISEAELTIVNLFGQMVNRKKIRSNNLAIYKTELPAGLYIVRILAKGKYHDKMLYIEN